MGVALTILAPVSAQAASVGREEAPPGLAPGTLSFQAAPGEINDVTVSATASEYRIEDRGAPLRAGVGCRQTADPRAVLCRRSVRGEFPGVVALLGDRNDSIRLPIGETRVDAGSGDDRLTGGKARDQLAGGSGDDIVVGGAGPDLLEGDDGDDELRGGRGHDVLSGGRGNDRSSGGSGNDAFLPNSRSLREPDDEVRGVRGADRVRGGPGLDGVIYAFTDQRSAPKLAVRFDGRANDGPRRERDHLARDLERVYSFAGIARCQTDRRRTRRQSRCRVGTFGLSPRPSNGELLSPTGTFELRIYRLSRRGTARAQAALFRALTAGKVRVSESRSRSRPTEMSLPRRKPKVCPARAGASRLSRRTIRRLRGRGRGRFRTRTLDSAATVRGTDWTIAERCDGTLTRVRRGTVVVRDLRRRRTIVLSAGESYLARARR